MGKPLTLKCKFPTYTAVNLLRLKPFDDDTITTNDNDIEGQTKRLITANVEVKTLTNDLKLENNELNSNENEIEMR